MKGEPLAGGTPLPAREAGLPAADLAIVFGSGLAVLPDGCVVVDEISYAEIGWPATQVTGHANRLVVCDWNGAGALPVRIALLFGRPHLYEGWSRTELERAVCDLAGWGVRRLLITNACGGLADAACPGAAVIVREVVDLQAPPVAAVERLPVMAEAVASRCAAALSVWLPARTGMYVALAGPHYETPAERRWLSRSGDVVGMSTAPEVRAGARHGLSMTVVALVVNRAGTDTSHDEVLTVAGRCTGRLRAGGLAALAQTAWPDLGQSHDAQGAA